MSLFPHVLRVERNEKDHEALGSSKELPDLAVIFLVCGAVVDRIDHSNDTATFTWVSSGVAKMFVLQCAFGGFG